MTWKPAPNLASRQAMVHAAYPTITIYSLGDAAHQSEASDRQVALAAT